MKNELNYKEYHNYLDYCCFAMKDIIKTLKKNGYYAYSYCIDLIATNAEQKDIVNLFLQTKIREDNVTDVTYSEESGQVEANITLITVKVEKYKKENNINETK